MLYEVVLGWLAGALSIFLLLHYINKSQQRNHIQQVSNFYKTLNVFLLLILRQIQIHSSQFPKDLCFDLLIFLTYAKLKQNKQHIVSIPNQNVVIVHKLRRWKPNEYN